MKTIIAIVLLMPAFLYAKPQATVDDLLDAIRKVETGGCPNNGEYARGDNGQAIGPYQIHYQYWLDSGVKGKYSDCNRLEYSRKVVKAYWKRYARSALLKGDLQTLARVHNGGPQGHRHKATVKYWERVCRYL